jgi:hypothetical protein
MHIPHSPNPYLPAFTLTTGAKFEAGPNGYVLPAGTYYIPIGGEGAMAEALHCRWDASAIGVITIEDTNGPDVLTYSGTAGDWIQENPSTAYVGILGGTVANLTVTVPGGTAGGCMIHLGNTGALRTRAKVVITTQGTLNFLSNGKA